MSLTKLLLRADERTWTRVFLSLYALALALSYATLVAPGRSYVRIWLTDTLGGLDIAYRVHLGQVPYRDFLVLYGPTVIYFPAWGLDLGLNAAVIFAFAAVIAAAIVLLPAAVALPCRMAPLPALLCFVYAWLMIVVPMEESGEAFTGISWGTFYNRYGWGALVIVLVFYLPPWRQTIRRQWVDAAAFATVVLFLVYTKFTFGLVAVAFVFANLFVSRYNRAMSLKALGIMVVIAGALELMLHFHALYLENIRTIVAAIPSQSLDIWAFIKMASAHAAIIIAAFAAWGAAYAMGRRNWLDGLYVVGCIGTAMLLRATIGGNSILGLDTAFVAMLVMGELARRAIAASRPAPALTEWRPYIPSIACATLGLMFAANEMANRLLAWEDHFAKSIHADPDPIPGTPPRLAGFTVVPKERGSLLEVRAPNDPEGKALDFYRRSPSLREAKLSTNAFMRLVVEGANLLETVDLRDRSVLSYLEVDPFSYALNLKPSPHGFPLAWVNITFSEAQHPTPEWLFTDIYYVMVPIVPYWTQQSRIMDKVYSPYLRAHYEPYKTSRNWTLWRRK